MVSVPRRERSGKVARRCLFVTAMSCLAACAGLLDLPDDPHLAEPEEPEEPAQPGDDPPSPPMDVSEDPLPGVNPPETDPGRDVGIDDAPLDPSEQMTSSGDDPSLPNPSAEADAGVAAPPDAAPAEPPEPPEPPPERCPTGATLGPNDRCYSTIATLLTWPDARAECQSLGDGWDLATIRGAAANDFVAVFMPAEAWLGGSDATVEGNWRWVTDNETFWNGTGTNGVAVGGAFENWNNDEPNGGGPSDCMRLVAGLGTWADLQCTFERPAVCEGPSL